ncbi:MAG TPA: hypothetical protein VJ805_01035, partial [Nitrospiraceae bacterium]|nr:hypothetical protein [Nitrospiraceae bacterium]
MRPIDKMEPAADRMTGAMTHSLFEPSRNCWRVETADRVAFLIDGDAYFRAFREAAIRARHSIMILGWD